jgi:hypothetical protein
MSLFIAPLLYPKAGIVVRHSVRLQPGVYALASSDLNRPALLIRGDHITVDLSGVTLRGTPSGTPPDRRQGLAILIDRGHDVTIRNGRISGYKLAILARNTTGLKLIDCDWSYNWKQRLKSTPEREDTSDWMFFHHNEHDEWVKGNTDTGTAYGCGGAYLTGCSRFRVDHCSDTGSQCGLMLNRCDHGTVIDCDFSFLSAVGIGLYRSSDNYVVRNALDYCVRGYSHFGYSRGQDSASILVYEQSCRNAFIDNSATRGGDGFFLWAGQSTMDSGKGGCNDNFVACNDFSHSPANGIEATFSRNTFMGNRLVECWHGVWGGFSYDSRWLGNTFQFDGQAVAIEHGQRNTIKGNTFDQCDQGIVAWMQRNRPADIGYLRTRDTSSRDYQIVGNVFSSCVNEAVKLIATSGTRAQDNKFVDCPTQIIDSDAPPARASKPGFLLADGNNNPVAGSLEGRFESRWAYMVPRGSLDRFAFDFGQRSTPLHIQQSPAYSHLLGPGEWGREHIVVGEWGPYDYRSPLLWPSRIPERDKQKQTLQILGPGGRWRLVSLTGARVAGPSSGQVPGTLAIEAASGQARDVRAVCEFIGAGIVDPLGQTVPAGRPYRFGWSRFFSPIQWSVHWYRWDASCDPRQAGGWDKMLGAPSIAADAPVGPLNYAGGSMFRGLPPDHYGTSADGTFTVSAGTYGLRLTTDDGARVSVDGRPVIANAWHYQGPTEYHATLHLTSGRHRIHVDHFQIDGYATLQVELTKG